MLPYIIVLLCNNIIFLLLTAAPCRSKRPRLGGHIHDNAPWNTDSSNVSANGLLHGIGEPNAGIHVFHLFYMSSKFLHKEIFVGGMMSEVVCDIHSNSLLPASQLFLCASSVLPQASVFSLELL